MATQSIRKVDQTGLKTGQALTIILLIVAFILNLWPLVAFVALAQLLGGLDSPFAPYRLFYQYILKPSGLVKPNIYTDNPEPHRFAMLVGAVFNGVGTLALLAGAATLGWTLVWIVIALANLNFWVNFCAGCWMYYQLNHLGVPGFTQVHFMIERIVFAAVLLAAGFVICRLYARRQLQRAASHAPTDPLLNALQPGVATIVYFTTPTCTPCRLQQTPTLQQLQQEMGDALRVIRVDATQDPDAADRWGVFSVPTTFVLDRDGHPRSVYNGVVDGQTLKRELEMQAVSH